MSAIGESSRIEVTVGRRATKHPVKPAWLERVALAALACEPIRAKAIHGGEVGIVVAGAAIMAEVNATHLNHKGPTDVITFDYAETDKSRRKLSGEILICPEVARDQSREFDTTVSLEMVRYVVHGLLHLCGYDDQTQLARRVMRRFENRAVKRIAETVPCDPSHSGCET